MAAIVDSSSHIIFQKYIYDYLCKSKFDLPQICYFSKWVLFLVFDKLDPKLVFCNLNGNLE